jgi:hypothetical protein
MDRSCIVIVTSRAEFAALRGIDLGASLGAETRANACCGRAEIGAAAIDGGAAQARNNDRDAQVVPAPLQSCKAGIVIFGAGADGG